MAVQRRMSFSTRLLAEGAVRQSVFLKETGLTDFPINAGLYMTSLPPLELVIQMFTEEVWSKEYRFRSLAFDDGVEMKWQEPEVPAKVEDHIIKIDVANDKEMHAIMESYCVKTLDVDKPLWQIVLLDNKSEGSQSAVIVRVCHCIGDGLGLLAVLLPLFKDKSGKPVALPTLLTRGRTKAERQSYFQLVLAVMVMLFNAVCAFFKCVALPSMPKDPVTSLMEPTRPYKYSGRRSLAFSKLLDLDKCKAISKRLHVTINDLMTTILTTSMTKYLGKRDEMKNVKNLRALIPISLPRPGAPLVNKWSFVSLSLPVFAKSFLDCLKLCQARLNVLKQSPEPYITRELQHLMSLTTPKSLQQQAATDLMTGHSLVFTNLPGPSEYMYLAGQRVESIFVYVANVNTQVSLLSYAGKFSLTVVADKAHLTDPDELLDIFSEEVDSLDKGTLSSSAR